MSFTLILVLITYIVKTHAQQWDEVEQLLRKGNGSGAKALIEKELMDNPADIKGRIYLARSIAQIGNLKESEIILLDILEEDKDAIDAHLTLGKIYIQVCSTKIYLH